MKIKTCYINGQNSVAILMDSGEMFYVYGLGQNSVSVNYAPDCNQNMEPLTIDGRKPEGPFTPF